MAGEERMKLLASRLVEGEGAPGTVLDGTRIACGSGAVEITRAQRPGRKAADAITFLQGYALPEKLD